jgi:hypothetical protein
MTPVEELFQLLWDTPKDKLTWFAIKNRMMEKEKLFISEAYYNAFINATKGIELDFEQYYNETFNTEEMTREEKLETIVKLFAKIMFYGDWEWETPNERVITMLMQEVGMYPFKDEDEMISQTQVSDELYKQAIKEITSRRAKGWDESITFKTSEK